MIISLLKRRMRWLHLRQTGFDADMALTYTCAGGSTTGLSATDAWGIALAGDDETLRPTAMRVELNSGDVTDSRLYRGAVRG